MPARPLDYLRAVLHPEGRPDGDEEALPQPSNSHLILAEQNVVDQPSSEGDGGEENLATCLYNIPPNQTRSVPGGLKLPPNPVTRFRSLPAKGPDGGPARPELSFSTLSLTLTNASSELTDFSAAAPPHKYRIWFQKAKNFIQQKGEYADDVDMEPSYRWLPIFSGVCVPFSILLEIPGLTGHWFIRTEMGKTVFTEKTPRILDIGLAISLASAVVANLALIRRYMEYRPKAMTLLAIVSLSIHDTINILAIIIFSVKKVQGHGFIFGQSFWMIIGSTLISIFTNITLLYDFIATKEFHRKGSGLTRKQRSLVIIVIILLCWMAVGAASYSHLMDLSFINAMYFTVVSIETVGFGDFAPHNTSSRIFSVFYNTVGILNLGMAISTCRETIIESFEHSYRKRLDHLMQSRLARKERRIRKDAIKQALIEAGLSLYTYEQQEENGHPEIHDTEEHHTFFENITLGVKAAHHAATHARYGHKAILNTQALSPVQMQWVNQTVEERILHEMELHQEYLAYPHLLQGECTVDEMREDLNTYGGTLKLLETLGLAGGASAMEAEQNREFMVKLTTSWVLFLLFWLVGGVIFSRTEGWSYGTAVFFCFVTFSTIGYGDLSPSTPAGRSVFIIWALLGVGTMTILISVLAEACSSKYQSILKTNNFHRNVQDFRKKYGRPDIMFKTTASADEKPPTKMDAAGPLAPTLAKDGKANEKPSEPTVSPAPIDMGGFLREISKEKSADVTMDESVEIKPPMEPKAEEASKKEGGPAGYAPTAGDHLPAELLGYMHEFQTHMLYFFNSNTAHPPATLTALLEDIMKVGVSKGSGKSDSKARKEVLHDDAGRKLLFMMSFEGEDDLLVTGSLFTQLPTDTMRKMMAAVEHHHPFTDVPVAATSPTRTKVFLPLSKGSTRLSETIACASSSHAEI